MRRSALLLCPVVTFVTLVGCGGSDDDDLASCLVGTWDGNPSEMVPVLAYLTSDDGSTSLTVGGSQAQVFQADGTHHLQVDVAVDLASNGPGDDLFEQGTAEGTWTLDGNRLTVTYTSTDIVVRTASASASATMQDGNYLMTVRPPPSRSPQTRARCRPTLPMRCGASRTPASGGRCGLCLALRRRSGPVSRRSCAAG